MGTKATFDGVNKIIQLTAAPVSGEVSTSVQIDLYSDMKEDWITDATLNKLRPPISVIGGQPTTGGSSAGDIYFLDAAWKIRPFEQDHRSILNGDIFSTDGSSIFTFTTGVFQVLTEIVVSSIVTKVAAGSGLSSAQDIKLMGLPDNVSDVDKADTANKSRDAILKTQIAAGTGDDQTYLPDVT